MNANLPEDEGQRPVRFYTKARKMRSYIAKVGTLKLPRGPYPIEAFVVLVAGLLATIYIAPRSGNPLASISAGAFLSISAATVVGKLPYTGVSYVSRALRLATHMAHPSNATYEHSGDLRPVLVGGTAKIHDRRPEAAKHAKEPNDFTDLFDEHHELPLDFFSSTATSGRR